MCAILFVNKLFKNTLLRRRGKTRPSGGGIRMQERHITTPGPVLDEHGVITPGYSERSICTYRRADIKMCIRDRPGRATHMAACFSASSRLKPSAMKEFVLRLSLIHI